MDYYSKIARGQNTTCLVLVHGILGDHKLTWGDFPFLICQESTLNHCDVLCWGYPSKLRTPKSAWFPFLGHKVPTVVSVAEALTTDLMNPEIGGRYTDLIMVGHSLGGLVIKQMIIAALTSLEENRQLLDRIRHVLLFATPTDGVQLPKILEVHPQAKSIQCDGTFINELRNHWINRVHAVKAGENYQPGRRRIPTTAVIALEDNAVPRESSQSIYLDCPTAQGTHTEVCKPTTRESTSFQILKKVVLATKTDDQSKDTETVTTGSSQPIQAALPANDNASSQTPLLRNETGSDSVSAWGEAHALMKEGRFNDAYDAFVRAAGEYESEARRIAMLSFGVYLLWTKGWPDAFTKLRQLCAENPTMCEPSSWLGHAYLATEQFEHAIACFRKWKDLTTGIDRIAAIEMLSNGLERSGNPSDAIKEFREALNETLDPPGMAQLYKALGNLLLRQRKDEPQFGIACFEKALSLDPHQRDLRFELAYQHGALIPKEEVFYQYRQLLAQGTDPYAANNAGVAAERLKLSLTSIDFFRLASNQDLSLAMSNLAERLVSVGFELEAREYLEKARRLKEVHENVDMVLGSIQRNRLREKEVIDTLDQKVRDMTAWRKKEGEAVARSPISMEILLGEYRDTKGDHPCTLSLSPDGTLMGTAKDARQTISFSGRIEGQLLRVLWNSAPHEKPASFTILSLAINKPDSGKGALMVGRDNEGLVILSGYRVKDEQPLEPEAWSLTKLSKAGA